MASGYDQFFKTAQQVNGRSSPLQKPMAKKTNAKTKKIDNSRNQTLAEFEAQIAKTLEAQSTQKRNKKRGIPWRLVITSIFGLLMTLWALGNIEKVEKFFTNIEIEVLGTAHAETAQAAESPVNGSDSKESAKTPVESAKKEWSKDDIDHFVKLNDRKRELDLREEELNRLEAELASQKQELENKLKRLEDTRGQISSVLEERVKVDEQKVDTLVQMYSNMKPQNAAKVFESIDEDLAVEVLGKMKKKNAADIMNLLKPEKAQVLSEKYAGYKKR